MLARLLIGLLTVHVLLLSSPAAAQQINLRITTHVPITNHTGVNLVRFKEEVERRTGKAITVEIFDRSQLYKETEVIKAVSSGAIEMGVTTSAQFVKKVPAMEIIEQPFIMNFYTLLRTATAPDNDIRRLLDKAVLEATGVRILWWQVYGNNVFFSKGGRNTRHPGGIEGQKIRVLGKMTSDLVTQCGGIPMIVPANQQNESLGSGQTDMTMTGVSGVTARELWKVTDTITRTDHAPIELIVTINENVWRSLADKHRSIIEEAARKVERELWDEIESIEEKEYDFARAKGMKVYELSPDDVAEWRACSARLVDDYIMSAGELGSRLMAAYGKLRVDPCCNITPPGAFTLH